VVHVPPPLEHFELRRPRTRFKAVVIMESLDAVTSGASEAPAAELLDVLPAAGDAAESINAITAALTPETTAEPAKDAAESEPERKRRKKNLSNDERRAMAEFLLQRCQGTGRLPHSALADAAASFGVHRNTASRIWQQLKSALVKGEPPLLAAPAPATAGAGAGGAASSNTAEAVTAPLTASGRLSEELAKHVLSRKRNSGRRKKDYSAELARLKALPMHQRGSLRALASAVGVPRTTLFRLLRDEEGGGGSAEADAAATAVHDTVKPLLSDKNKMERLRFCAAKLRPNGLFDDMLNVIHLNMRPFSLCGTVGGDGKGETGKRKARVMFLAAVARPQWDAARNAHFDGKIGVWPFLSAAADTPTVVEAVTKAEIQQLLISRVLPAIREKLPRHQHVLVQLDSQHVRLPPDDPVVSAHGSVDGWSMRLQYQPAYSPDLVVLDNAFFRTIELSVKESRPETLAQLETAVERAFAAMPKRRVTDAFLVLQKKMEATMRVRGSNTYEMAARPTKRSLQQDGSLPISVLCDPAAALECRAALEMVETVL
jgi:transposase-like protein